MRIPLRERFVSGRATRLLPVLALVFCLLSATAGQSRADDDREYSHPRIDIVYRLLPDGSASVEETRAYRFEGSFSNAFLKKETAGQYGTYGIEFLSVEDADTGEPLQMSRIRKEDAERVRWEYSARDETRRFRIRYRITGAVQRYGDAAQFYWKAIEDRHAPIDLVSIEIIPPAPSPGLFKVFVHRRASGGVLEFADDFSRATVRQGGIGSRGFVEVRALLDPALFSGAPVLSGETHESLLADERRFAEAEQRRLRMMLAGLFVGAGTILVFVILYIWFFLRFGKEPAVDYDRVYEREPPRKLPAVFVPAILSQGKAPPSEYHKSFAAALLSCARLGYLEIEETREEKLFGEKEGLRYSLTDAGKTLLVGEEPEPRRGERPLDPFERDVLDVVINEAGDGTSATTEDVRKWAKKSRGSKTAFLHFCEPRMKELRRRFERNHFELDDPGSARMRGVFIGLSLALAALDIVLFFAVMRHPALIAIGIAIGILGSLLSIPLARWTPEGALEEKRWKAFRKFMEDFSAMKEAGAGLLALWETYLVYATALGVADKLLDNIRDLAVETRAAVPPALWFHPAASRGVSTGALSSFEGISSAFESLQSLSTGLSSSTSTGGGFSGGGGGGGGGGCSGAG